MLETLGLKCGQCTCSPNLVVEFNFYLGYQESNFGPQGNKGYNTMSWINHPKNFKLLGENTQMISYLVTKFLQDSAVTCC